jgi:cytochrome c oxidase subunit 3
VTIALVLLSAIMAIVVGWLVHKTLNTTPWVEQRTVDVNGRDGALALLPVQVGLGVFLAVATSLFALLITAYHMRMMEADWTNLDLPRVLWLNSAVLVLASVAMQWTLVAARRGQIDSVRKGLAASGVFSFAFPRGAGLGLAAAQWIRPIHVVQSGVCVLPAAHRDARHPSARRPGGVGEGDAARRPGADFAKVRLSVELCTVYWHFLLLVWAVLFAVLLYSHR